MLQTVQIEFEYRQMRAHFIFELCFGFRLLLLYVQCAFLAHP
jgi:hypothetical protein